MRIGNLVDELQEPDGWLSILHTQIDLPDGQTWWPLGEGFPGAQAATVTLGDPMTWDEFPKPRVDMQASQQGGEYHLA
jgi:hypothetical protein